MIKRVFSSSIMKRFSRVRLERRIFLVALIGVAYLAGRLTASIQTPMLSVIPIQKPPWAFAAGSIEKFTYLSSQQSSFCGLQPTMVDGYADEERLQGSCCSAMDLHRYQEQVEFLRRYSSIPHIPEDPYDIPVPLAKELIAYGTSITLTAREQTVYDEAVQLSEEGGPCCCRCWRWFAFEGLGKYLIAEHGFGAEQIAELWDGLDGCGGTSHLHE
jgi:hypothetical protein